MEDVLHKKNHGFSWIFIIQTFIDRLFFQPRLTPEGFCMLRNLDRRGWWDSLRMPSVLDLDKGWNTYPLVNWHMENHHFQWVNPLFLSISMVTFNSYVKLPEGISSLVGGFNHIEKYEFVNGWWIIQYNILWKIKKWCHHISSYNIICI